MMPTTSLMKSDQIQTFAVECLSMRSSIRCQSSAKPSIMCSRRVENTSLRVASNWATRREGTAGLGGQECLAPEGSPDLIDHAGALRHQRFAHPMQRLQIELFNGFGRHEPHGRPPYRLGDGFRVAEVAPCNSRSARSYFGKHGRPVPFLQIEEEWLLVVARHAARRSRPQWS
jgi:hypothetical protein